MIEGPSIGMMQPNIGPGVSTFNGCVYESSLGRSAFGRLSQDSVNQAIKAMAVDAATARSEIAGDPIGIFKLKVKEAKYRDKITGDIVKQKTLVSPDFNDEPISVWTDAGENGTGTWQEYRLIVDRANKLSQIEGNASMFWLSPGDKTSQSETPHRAYLWVKEDDEVTAYSYSLGGAETSLEKMMVKLGYQDNGKKEPIKQQTILTESDTHRLTHQDVFNAYVSSLLPSEYEKSKNFVEQFKLEVEIPDSTRLKRQTRYRQEYHQIIEQSYQNDIRQALESIAHGLINIAGNTETTNNVNSSLIEHHWQTSGSLDTPRWIKYPVPKDQFTHRQVHNPHDTGIENISSPQLPTKEVAKTEYFKPENAEKDQPTLSLPVFDQPISVRNLTESDNNSTASSDETKPKLSTPFNNSQEKPTNVTVQTSGHVILRAIRPAGPAPERFRAGGEARSSRLRSNNNSYVSKREILPTNNTVSHQEIIEPISPYIIPFLVMVSSLEDNQQQNHQLSQADELVMIKKPEDDIFIINENSETDQPSINIADIFLLALLSPTTESDNAIEEEILTQIFQELFIEFGSEFGNELHEDVQVIEKEEIELIQLKTFNSEIDEELGEESIDAQVVEIAKEIISSVAPIEELEPKQEPHNETIDKADDLITKLSILTDMYQEEDVPIAIKKLISALIFMEIKASQKSLSIENYQLENFEKDLINSSTVEYIYEKRLKKAIEVLSYYFDIEDNLNPENEYLAKNLLFIIVIFYALNLYQKTQNLGEKSLPNEKLMRKIFLKIIRLKTFDKYLMLEKYLNFILQRRLTTAKFFPKKKVKKAKKRNSIPQSAIIYHFSIISFSVFP